MYREDVDLCRRLRDLGLAVRFEPSATVVHLEGASAPRGRMIPVLAASRLLYASKHYGGLGAALERLSVAIHAFTHALLGRGGFSVRAGHIRALRTVLRPPRFQHPVPAPEGKAGT
jgi:GT2 family glycosyltransferase